MDPLFGQTPCYVFDESLFRKRVRAVSKLLGDEIGLCYSIKANPFLLQMLPEEFSRIEVCSPGELAICERLGLDMKKVVFSGVNKSAGEIKRALDDGAGFLTAESRDHYEAICRDGRPADIFLRLTSGNQFGMDAGQITDIIAQHHGTRVIRCFYQKAIALGENPNESDYSYPGPKPQTKEAAILMLADSVEASSRTLTDPTPARLKAHVDKISKGIFPFSYPNDRFNCPRQTFTFCLEITIICFINAEDLNCT